MKIYPNYEKIGNDVIYKNGDTALDIYQRGYFFEENMRIEFFIGTVKITDLNNAMLAGKECECRVFTQEKWTGNFAELFCDLSNLGFKTFSDILNAEEIEGFVRRDYTEKSIRTFSPFHLAKPIKLPKKWTSSLIAKAMLSGQIYFGVTERHLTDDYAQDSACRFGKGVEVDLISQARKFIEEKPSGLYITSEENENGHWELRVSTYSYDYKTYLFDEKCDLEIAELRKNQREKDLHDANNSALDSVISVNLSEISDDVIYHVTTLEENRNTGGYDKKSMLMYPESLRKMEKYDMKIVELEPTAVENTVMYKIYNLQHPIRPRGKDDARFICVGDEMIAVTGFALKELLREKRRFPVLEKTIDVLGQMEALKKMADRKVWHFSDIINSDFSAHNSIELLEREIERAYRREEVTHEQSRINRGNCTKV